MRGKILAAALSTLAGLTGCTHLEVNSHKEGNAPPNGYAYMLDYTQYQVTLSRTLAECTPGEMPVINAEVKVAPMLVPDGEHLYVIDPSSMISAFKTSDVLVDYKDGRLVGFNASTVDKTGEVLGSVITTVGKVAMLAVAPIPVFGGTQFCTVQAVEKLKVISDNKQPIKDATANIEDAEAQLSTLSAQYAAKPTERLRVRIKTLTANIKTARDALDKRTKATTDALAWLTDTVTITWPEASTTFSRGPGNPLGPAIVAKWFDVAAMRSSIAAPPESKVQLDADGRVVVEGHEGTAERLGVTPEVYAKLYPELPAGTKLSTCLSNNECKAANDRAEKAIVDRQMFRRSRAPISLQIVRRGSYGTMAAAPAPKDPKGAGDTKDAKSARAGLRYRVPAAGSLFVCNFDEPCHLGARTPLARTDGAIAQLGTVFNIPFNSPVFASGSMNVKFDDQGRLLQAGLKRESSTALGAVTAVGAAVDQLSSVLAAAEKAPITEANNATKLAQARKALADAEAALTKTPQQLATEELALLKTQQEIAAARAALGPDRAKDLTKDLQIAKLELELAEIQRKQAVDPNADQAVVAAQYDAETALLNARRASLVAEKSVIEAERALDVVRSQPK